MERNAQIKFSGSDDELGALKAAIENATEPKSAGVSIKAQPVAKEPKFTFIETERLLLKRRMWEEVRLYRSEPGAKIADGTIKYAAQQHKNFLKRNPLTKSPRVPNVFEPDNWKLKHSEYLRLLEIVQNAVDIFNRHCTCQEGQCAPHQEVNRIMNDPELLNYLQFGKTMEKQIREEEFAD